MQTNFRPANLQSARKSIPSHSLVLIGLIASLLALAACQPIRDPAVVAAERTAIASGTTVPVTGAATVETPEATETLAPPAVEPATATISTRSARVRGLPSEEGEVVAAVNEGDNFPVIGISSDGGWIQISIEEAPDGTGWISAELVTLLGDITNIAVVDVATAEATEEVTTEEEATEEATVEATEEVTETVEATTEATVEATEEATPEPAVEVTEEVTEGATEEVTEGATEEVTVEATAEVTATLEATEEVTETVEATPEATDEATEEATEGDTEGVTGEVSTPEVGTTVTIVTDLPLRVRSEPTAETDENKIGNVFNGEVYTVLAVSDDGLWLQIEVPELGDGTGWISAEYVTYGEAG